MRRIVVIVFNKCTKYEVSHIIYYGGPNISKWVTWPKTRSLTDNFLQQTKCLTYSISGQNLERVSSSVHKLWVCGWMYGCVCVVVYPCTLDLKLGTVVVLYVSTIKRKPLIGMTKNTPRPSSTYPHTYTHIQTHIHTPSWQSDSNIGAAVLRI